MKKQESTTLPKKTYDDITFDKRRDLIYLINEQRWTIKSAAHELGIKLCTAKYILYQYRKRGKISRKKRNYCLYPLKSSNEVQPETNIQYVFVPYPVYVFCPPLENEATFNLDCKTE